MERPWTMDRYRGRPQSSGLRRTESLPQNRINRKASAPTLSSIVDDFTNPAYSSSSRLAQKYAGKKRNNTVSSGNSIPPVPLLPEQPEIERMVTPGVVFIRAQPSASSLSSSIHSERPLLQRIFSRGRSQSEHSNGNADIPFEFVESPSVSTMNPSPNTHPLLSQPIARDELPGGRSAAECAHLNGGLTGTKGTQTERKPMTIGTAKKIAIEEGPRSPTTIAKTMAMEERCGRDWPFYIKCYSEGLLNISSPPQPPKRLESKHFSAPFPPNEKQRLKAAKACNVSLPSSTHEIYNRMTLTARNTFQTRMAAITLIDENVEILKADHGFDNRYVNRSESFGSHVLLSSETMVILDSWMDWRFKNNPLVLNGACIRFYAGAPIVTNDGHAVGVFAVFDSQPRSSFPVASRRKLMEFAREAMAEVELIMEEREVMKKQINHTLYKIMGRNSRQSFASVDLEEVVSKSKKCREKFLRDIECRPERTMEAIVSPDSPEDNMEVPSRPAPQDMSKKCTSQPQRTNTTDDYTVSFHQDANGPDVSITIHNHGSPPRRRVPEQPIRTISNVPERKTSAGNKLTKAHSFSRPFGYGMQTPPTTPKTYHVPSHYPTPSVPSISSATSKLYSTPSIASMAPSTPKLYSASSIPSMAPTTPKHYSYTAESPLKSFFPHSTELITTFAEATVATSSFAHSLNFDLVYFLRVGVSMDMHDTAQPYTTTRVLISHGLPSPPPIFDTALHLRALRSGGGLVYQNPASEGDSDDVGFQLGILLPLIRDGEKFVVGEGSSPGSLTDEGYVSSPATSKTSSCSSGIVIAAFTKRLGRGFGSFTADEVRSLKKFGDACRDVLTRDS